MIIQNLTENLNFNKIKYNAVNGGNNRSIESFPCKCSIIIINYYETKNIIVSADLIWFSFSLVEKIRKKLFKEQGIKENEIVFCASHTHGSPNPDPNIGYGINTDNIENYLYEKIFTLICKTFKSKKIEIKVNYKILKTNNLSINRRKKALQFNSLPLMKMQSLPNYRKNIDKNINLIEFIRKDNQKIENIIIQYTCHPVCDPNGIVGADYPGYLKKYLNDSTCKNILFMQGFCGDIRPKVIKKNIKLKDKFIKLLIGDRFRKIVKGDAEYLAKNLYKTIKCNKNLKKEYTLNSNIISKTIKLPIPLKNNSYTKNDLEITIWIWDKICFIFMSAEVLSGYNFGKINNLDVINVGYSNGMLGYLPTKNDILNGGYEVDKSRPPFGIHARIDESTEQIINDTIKETIKNLIN